MRTLRPNAEKFARDAAGIPAFVRDVRGALEAEFPAATGGRIRLDRSRDGRGRRWSLVGTIGLASGFRLTFETSEAAPDAVTVKLARTSRLLGKLYGIAIGLAVITAIAFLVGLETGAIEFEGTLPVLWVFLVPLGIYVGSAWCLGHVIMKLAAPKLLARVEEIARRCCTS